MAYDISKLSKYQQEVQKLHDKHYGEISPAFRTWAEKKAGEIRWLAHPYSTETLARWCPHCGKVIKADCRGGIETFPNAGTEMNCPHCGKPIRVADYRHDYHYSSNTRTTRGCKYYKDFMYLEEVTTCKGWQIDRIWVADFEFRKGKSAKMTMLASAYERWFNPATHKEVLLGKYVGAFPYARRLPFAFDSFNPCDGWVHRTLQLHGNPNCYSTSSAYVDSNASFVYPHARVLDTFVKRGITAELLKSDARSYHDCAVLFRPFINKKSAPFCETIFKLGTKDEVKLMLDRGDEFAKYWQTIRIARRNHFDYAQYGGEYFDYLGQLERLHLDLNSPHYVAPKDFKRMHQIMTNRIQAILDRERELRLIAEEEERLKHEGKIREEFAKYIKRYAGLVISNDKWVAKPLMSVDEFFEEGKEMHHCVYGRSYYDTKKHPDSLILSVRSALTNKRVVTIELNTKTWLILQCYGPHDSINKDDKAIRELINTNIEQIKALSKKKSARVSA